jgi:phosphoribosyl-dephospho-CoA transferase
MAARPELSAELLVSGWAARRWPLVQRRRLCGDPPGEVPLGLPLPPSYGKRRIAFSLPEAGVSDFAPPPCLQDCMASGPPHWQTTLAALLALDSETRCFGGLAWQRLTGLAYLSPQSDLDLIWGMPPNLPEFLDGLRQIADAAPMPIDGEINGPNGAVQWRELASGAEMLAVKQENAVALLPRAAWLEGVAA